MNILRRFTKIIGKVTCIIAVGSTVLESSSTLTISPSPVTVGTGQTVQFKITRLANPNASWSVDAIPGGNATVGTISPAGLYTAPASVGRPTTVTVQAVTKSLWGQAPLSAEASVTIVPANTLSGGVSPQTASVQVNQSQQFTATVSGSSNTSVVWSVSSITGGNTAVGTISSSGFYTAPAVVPSPSRLTITATSVADATKSASASVNITTPPAISISPTSAALSPSQSQQFAAKTSGLSSTSVVWSVNGIVGGNSTVGSVSNSGLYTAPTSVPGSGTITVTATSSVNSSVLAQAAVTIIAGSLVVSPSSTTIGTAQSFQFTATVAGSSASLNSTQLIWSVNGVQGGSSSAGTISQQGLYTAPKNPPSPATIKISAAANSMTGTASATIVAIAVSVSPSKASVGLLQTQQFSATVAGSASTAVAWSVNGVQGGNTTVGTISTSGLYTAPAAIPAGSIAIFATSVADPSRVAQASVTLLSAVTVSISPTSISIATSATRQFTATVSGTTNTGVNWNVNGIAGGNTTVGTISTNGLYTAPASIPAGSIAIFATSVANPSMVAQASVTLLSAVTVSISPTSVSIATSATRQFTATVSGTTNTGVNWNVNGIAGGNTTVGTISTNGLYTAPASIVPGGVTVTAVTA